MAEPLVTFIIFAYNQEAFVADAVKGALAQTYAPLEIVISDDCSTDRTFEVISNTVAGYSGPHDIRVVRNDSNMGLLDHVFARGREARGQYIVMAAGDDMSMPERTALSVAAFGTDPDILAVTSRVDIIDATGQILAADQARPLGLQPPALFLKGHHAPVQGCSAVYSRKVFDIDIPPRDVDYAEDILFAASIALRGGSVAQIPKALVRYRFHPNALSNRDDRGNSAAVKERDNRITAQRTSSFIDAVEHLAEAAGQSDMLDRQAISAVRMANAEKTAWDDKGVVKRIASLAGSLWSGQSALFRWKAARLLGRYPTYQPIGLLRKL